MTLSMPTPGRSRNCYRRREMARNRPSRWCSKRGVADVDAVSVVTPVDLGALAGYRSADGEEGGGTHRTHALEVVLDDGGAADVAGLAHGG